MDNRARGRGATLALLLIGCVACLLVPSGSAAAQVYPPNEGCQLTASASVVAPGDVVLVTGVDFAPGEIVDLFLLSDPVFLTSVTADSAGSFSVEVTIPAGTVPGPHEIRASSGSCAVSSGLTVSGASGATGGGRLAFTGSDSLPWAWIALVMVSFGSALVVGARRRARGRRPSTT